MGCWFFASAAGNFAAGMIARATGSDAASGSDAAQDVVLGVYSKIGWIAIAVGVGFLAISPLIRKLMHLNTLKDDDHVLAGASELAEQAASGLRTRQEERRAGKRGGR